MNISYVFKKAWEDIYLDKYQKIWKNVNKT